MSKRTGKVVKIRPGRTKGVKTGPGTGAPLGNNFWEVRSKHGRDKVFKTPAIMWEAACEYFQWVVDNPWYKIEVKVVDKYIYQEKVPTIMPFTLHGLCLFLDVNTAYFRQFKATGDKDFSTVIARIEEVIYKQKFDGAGAGFFNANIISRDLGLIDKKQIEHDVPEDIKKHFPFGQR